MSQYLIEICVSWVIFHVSKHNTWYSTEENPRLKKKKSNLEIKRYGELQGRQHDPTHHNLRTNQLTLQKYFD